MQCPRCLETTRQKWHRAFPADQYCPAEPEGYDCGWCGLWYQEGPPAMQDCTSWYELEQYYSGPDIKEWRDYQSREQLNHVEWLALFGGEEEPNDEERAA